MRAGLLWAQALEIMEAQIMPGSEQLDVQDRAAVAARIKGSVCSKMYGFEDLLSPLIAQVRRALSRARAQAPQVRASQSCNRLARADSISPCRRPGLLASSHVLMQQRAWCNPQCCDVDEWLAGVRFN